MSDWWKAPILQGEDNEYGQYDYLIEEIPQDYAKWELSKYKWKCDDCGKDSHLRFVAKSYFHTLDGWDEHSWATCWRCAIKDWIVNVRFRLIHNTHRHIKVFKDAIELYNAGNGKHSFRSCYEFVNKLH